MIKVRFAPSPTGYLHIGGARTALFNWMYARAQAGKFVLRIEDTDRQRSRQEFVDEILDSMRWLGLAWDELYYQSQRFDIYRKKTQELLDQDKAYKDGEAVILKMPAQEIKIDDLIRGEIVFDTATIKDQVLMKSDGSPTYSFACVVDDAAMEITHVIRGEDHISNTPKQIMIYQALGLKPPKFAHLPLIMGDEGRLSKRTGAVAVSDYRKDGFLPEAIVNYLMLLGWSPGGNQEKVGLACAVKKFSIKKVNKAAAIFSMDKLKWLNGQYIKEMPAGKLTDLIIPFLKEKGYISADFDRERLEKIVDLFKVRMATLTDFLEWADFIFVDKLTVGGETRQQHLSHDRSKEFQLLSERISRLDTFDAASLEKVFRDLVAELGIQASELVHPVRVALTGKTIGPGLFDTMAILGKEKTVQRLQAAFL
ncbi:MAG: glutamate--tRNA ligase [Candidatus Omnitrophica bacterium]|nr:glutamate--tRNA ligase [Candidatus Omnitrophota bacterium]